MPRIRREGEAVSSLGVETLTPPPSRRWAAAGWGGREATMARTGLEFATQLEDELAASRVGCAGRVAVLLVRERWERVQATRATAGQ